MSSDDEYDMMYDSEGDADIGGSDNGSEQSGSEEEDPEVEVENKYFEAKGKYLCCNCLSYSWLICVITFRIGWRRPQRRFDRLWGSFRFSLKIEEKRRWREKLVSIIFIFVMDIDSAIF